LYLQTVRFALAGPSLYPISGCCGFSLSPEFLQSSSPIALAYLDRILAMRAALQVGQDIAIVDNRCGTDMPRSYLATHNFFLDVFQFNVGNFQAIVDDLRDRIGARFSTLSPPVPISDPRRKTRDGMPTGAVIVTNTFVRAAGGMKFDVQFPSGSNAVLLVFVDGVFACQVNQQNIGTNLVNTGEIVFRRLYSAGAHTIAFHLVPDLSGWSEVLLENVELGYDPRPIFLQPVVLPGEIQLNILSMEGRTNYTTEASTNLVDWTVLTNVQSTSSVIRVIVPIGSESKGRFFRLQAR